MSPGKPDSWLQNMKMYFNHPVTGDGTTSTLGLKQLHCGYNSCEEDVDQTTVVDIQTDHMHTHTSVPYTNRI